MTTSVPYSPDVKCELWGGRQAPKTFYLEPHPAGILRIEPPAVGPIRVCRVLRLIIDAG